MKCSSKVPMDFPPKVAFFSLMDYGFDLNFHNSVRGFPLNFEIRQNPEYYKKSRGNP